MKIDLRPATLADGDWLGTLRSDTMRTYVEKMWGTWDDEQQRARFDAEFEPANYRIVTADGRDVGLLHVVEAAHEIFLANIQIAPASQNLGLGTYIIRQVQRTARKRHLPVRLQVLKTNPSARRLYERLGFTVVDETPNHIRMIWRPT